MKSLQIGNKFGGIDSLFVNNQETEALFRYGGYHAPIPYINVFLIHSVVCISLAIATRGQRTLGEVSFVKKEKQSSLLFGGGYLVECI